MGWISIAVDKDLVFYSWAFDLPIFNQSITVFELSAAVNLIWLNHTHTADCDYNPYILLNSYSAKGGNI